MPHTLFFARRMDISCSTISQFMKTGALNGSGTELLRAFGEFCADKKGILLEAKHTADAENEADAVIRQKRNAFYKRCGCARLP